MKNILFLFFAFALFYGCGQTENTAANTAENTARARLYHNGNILTMQSETTPEYAETLVEQDGKIVFVGSKADATAKYPAAKQIDLQRKTLLPGFIDPHSHFGMVSNSMGQVDLNPPPVGDVLSIEDAMEKIKMYKAENNIADGE